MHYAQHHEIGEAATLPAGAIPITSAQYRTALEAIGAGYRVTVAGGALAFYRGPVQTVDAEGFHAGEAEALPDGAPLIEAPPEAALVRPRWDGAGWAEGATQDELATAAAQRVATARAAALARITAGFEAAVDALRNGYPPSEVQSWAKQESEARALAVWDGTGAGPATPLVDGIAAARALARPELAGRILTKADAFAAAIAPLIGRRQVREAEAAAAAALSDPGAARAALEALDW